MLVYLFDGISDSLTQSESAFDSNIVRGSETDSNGEYSFTQLRNGSYTVKAKKNGIFTVASPVVVNGGNPAPVLLEPTIAALPSTLYAPWNTSLQMINVVELSNNGNSDISVNFTMRDFQGNPVKSAGLVVPSNSKYDLIISSLVEQNQYGTVQFTTSGPNTESFRCDMVNYRPARVGSGKMFEYVFSIPCQVANYGATSSLTNRLFPGDGTGLRRISNWLTLANLSGDPHVFTVRSYAANGDLLNVSYISLDALARFDANMAAFADVTLFTVSPDDATIPYMSLLGRYDDGDSNSRVMAFSSYAQEGTSGTRCVPVANVGSAESYTEMGNPGESTNTVFETLYNADGTLAESTTLSLPPHGVRHTSFARHLPIGTSGTLCLRTDAPDSLVFNELTYYFVGRRVLETGFLTPPNELTGVATMFGAKNYFFNSFNWLRLMNLSDSTSNVEVTTDPNEANEVVSSYTIAAHARLDVPLHSLPFKVIVNDYGRFQTNSSQIAATVVRVIPNGTSVSATSAILTTSVR